MRPTDEQWRVIQHPVGQHAKVLAVAGSGKTTTLVLRIRHLVSEGHTNPNAIVVLMFNAMARKDFRRRTNELDVPADGIPRHIHTYHSFAYMVMRRLESAGLRQRCKQWTAGQQQVAVARAIDTVGRRLNKPYLKDQIDAGEAAEAIAVWKASLIAPEDAGYQGREGVPLVYREYEAIRTQENAVTFDDYVPIAVAALRHPGPIAAEFRNRFDFVIVDEYQDINDGQQVMLELLAGTRADVMVVGDDDQTIYEWRGARPQYILHEFARRHPDKPHAVYGLTHSFRFGPVLAQCALNTIRCNASRAVKSLAAQDVSKQTQVIVVADVAEEAEDVDKQLAEEVVALTDQHGVSPRDVVVLARMYAQLSGLEAEFLRRGIPYRVEGNDPFFARREIQVLCAYLLAGKSYAAPLTEESIALLCRVVNSPNRKISSALFRRELESAASPETTPAVVLERLCDARQSPFSAAQREALLELANTLGRLHEWLTDDQPPAAGDVLANLVRMIGLEQAMIELYGDGESAAERLLAVDQFIAYARETGLPPIAFLEHVDHLDPTQGRPEDEQILMTSIFRTKGLEFDYVVIPHCEEGLLPCLFSSPVRAFDNSGKVQPPQRSDDLDNERRLFYVALTRARQVAYIGFSERPRMGYVRHDAAPSRFIAEMQLPAVTEVIGPLQAVIAGETAAAERLAAGMRKHAGASWLDDASLRHYLAAGSQESGVGDKVTG